MVYPVWLSEKQPQDHAMVLGQDPSELSGYVGRIAKGAVAEMNYYNVRQSYRTYTNYRVLYRCRNVGCIIIYKKCESSQLEGTHILIFSVAPENWLSWNLSTREGGLNEKVWFSDKLYFTH
jgi:hypothetical protein